MATLKPFRPFRYSSQAGDPATLLTQPYDKISPAMQARYLAASPHNLVRVILGERRDSDTDADNVYTRGAEYFNDWIRAGILAQDAAPGFYAYFQEFAVPDSGERLTRKGFIGLGKVEDYSAERGVPPRADALRPEEGPPAGADATRARISARFSCCIRTTQAKSIANWTHAAARRARCSTSSTNTARGHRLWAITDPARIARIQELMAPMKLLIADGHHRYETALNYRTEHTG